MLRPDLYRICKRSAATAMAALLLVAAAAMAEQPFAKPVAPSNTPGRPPFAVKPTVPIKPTPLTNAPAAIAPQTVPAPVSPIPPGSLNAPAATGPPEAAGVVNAGDEPASDMTNAPQADVRPQPLKVMMAGNAVSVEADNVTLGQILKEMGRVAGFDVIISPDMSSKPLSTNLKNVSPQTAVQRIMALLNHRNYFIYLRGDGSINRVEVSPSAKKGTQNSSAVRGRATSASAPARPQSPQSYQRAFPASPARSVAPVRPGVVTRPMVSRYPALVPPPVGTPAADAEKTDSVDDTPPDNGNIAPSAPGYVPPVRPGR